MNCRARYRIILPLAMLVALASLAGCQGKKPPPPPDTTRPPVNVSIMTIVPLASKTDAFDLHAKVEPNRVVHVAAEVDGRIEEICCEEGARVTAGSDAKPIIKLNTDLLDAKFEQAKAKSDIDALDHKRMKRLHSSGTSTESELQRSKAQADTSKAILDEAQAMRDRTKIFPPINGVLNNRPVEKGDYVQPGTIVAEIVDTDTVKIVAHVPERDIHFLKLGDKTKIIYTYQRQGRSRDAKITFISKISHARSLTTRIEVKVDNSSGEFFSGQIVKVRLKRREMKNVIMIPLDAVIPMPQGDGQSRYAAYVVEGDLAKRRIGIVIDLSFIEGKNVRLVSGLKAGEKLIIAGHRYVGPDQAIRVIDPTTLPTTRPTTQTEKGI
jgi:membrane fusion protein, multidrug efflux system